MHHSPSPELASAASASAAVAAAGEIQTLIPASAASPGQGSGEGRGGGGGSFTALLGLPTSQAMELLFPAPTFPSDPHLVDRAARFSTFASASPSTSPPPPPPPRHHAGAPAAKRKDTSDRAGKVKAAKKGRVVAAAGGVGGGGEGGGGGEEEKPAYVHVRARRGQATDSHSLAERARREKINARMELLKELVPGCSKVSGTALVLDEIINHVQSLQRQVEYLSMRLAAVNPRVDLGGLDSFLTAEYGRITGLNCKNGIDLEHASWSEMGIHGARQLVQLQQQIWHGDLGHPHQLPPLWERRGDSHPPVFVNSGASLFGYDLASSAAQSQPGKLKTEL